MTPKKAAQFSGVFIALLVFGGLGLYVPNPPGPVSAGPMKTQAAAPTPVQFVRSAAAGGTTTPFTFSIAIPAGDASVVYAYSQLCGAMGISDSGGNIYSKAVMSTGCTPGQAGLVIFISAPTTHAASSVTITGTNGIEYEARAMVYTGVQISNQGNGYQLSTTSIAWTTHMGGADAMEIFAGWSGATNVSSCPPYTIDPGTVVRYNAKIAGASYVLAGDSSYDVLANNGLTFGVSWGCSLGVHAVTIELIPAGVIYTRTAGVGSATAGTTTVLNIQGQLIGNFVVIMLQLFANNSEIAFISDAGGSAWVLAYNGSSTGVYIWYAWASRSYPDAITLTWSPASTSNIAWFILAGGIQSIGSVGEMPFSGAGAAITFGQANPYNFLVAMVGSLAAASKGCTTPIVGDMTASSSTGGGSIAACIGDNSNGFAPTITFSTTLTGSIPGVIAGFWLHSTFTLNVTQTPWINPPANASTPGFFDWLPPLVFVAGCLMMLGAVAAAGIEFIRDF